MVMKRARRLALAVAIAAPVALAGGGALAAPATEAPTASDLGPQTVIGFTGLTAPYGVAVAADGAVTATSFPDQATTVARVVRRTASAEAILATGELGSPFGVALGRDGATYVTDASEGEVVKVPAGGGAATRLAFTGLSFPTGVAVDSAGTVYVADSGNGRITRLTTGGAQSDVAFTGLQSPYGVAVDAAGTVYVADLDADAVVKRTTGGTQTTLGFTGLDSPDGIAVAADGDVFVADAGNDRVLELPAAGGSQAVVPFSGLDEPAGVAVAADGSIYVADAGNDRVVALLDSTTPRPANESFVIAAYNDFIDRDPTPAELSSALTALATGGSSSRAAFLRTLSTSDTYVGAVVNRFYRDTLGRNGDASGVAFWTQQIKSGRRTVAQVAADFYSSPEYFNGIGGGNTTTWVRDLYAKVLLRQPDAGGLQYWVGVAESRGRGYVSRPFFQSNESARTRVRLLYRDLLGRAPDSDGLTFWAGRVVTSGDLALAVNLANSAEYFNRAGRRFP